MSISPVITCALVITALASAQGASAQNRPATPAAPAAAANAPAPAVAEPADRVLKEVGAYIGSANEFTFHADITFDHVLPSGQKLQFSAAEEVVLQRPGRLYVEWNGDLGVGQFWYDGKSVTLYDPATPFYASEAAPPAIDSMLDQLVPKLDFAPPLADFLYSDPYKSVRGNIQYGFDLGQNDVNGRICRTLAFVEKDIDWQIWIEKRAATHPLRARDHLQDAARAAAIRCDFQRLGLRFAHRRAGVHAGVTGGRGENPVRDGHRCQVVLGGHR